MKNLTLLNLTAALFDTVKTFTFLVLLICSLHVMAEQSKGYYQYADIHNDTLVFAADGDIWRYDLEALSQGKSSSQQSDKTQAVRLTANPSVETHIKISPDGQSIAFVASYHGIDEVYTMSIVGSQVKRLSFEQAKVTVQGWTDQGEVLYATTSAIGPHDYWTLKTVNPQTLKTTTLPLADAIGGVVDDANRYVYFVQFGLGRSKDNARVYRGGAMGQIWRFDLAAKDGEAQLLTKSHIGNAREPMLYGNRLYFISDASGLDNIWSMSLDGTDIKAHTNYQDWPVRNASMHNGQMVYQRGADIWFHQDLVNTKTTAQVLDISLLTDFNQLNDHWLAKPLKYLTSAELSVKSKPYHQLVINGRGKTAIANLNDRRLVQINSDDNTRLRHSVLDITGRYVYALSDKSGVVEVWRFGADGSNEAKQLTFDGTGLRWQLVLSPDGKWLAHDDNEGNVWLLSTKDHSNKRLFSGGIGTSGFADIVFSPNSQLVAVTRQSPNDERSRIVLANLADGKQAVLTSDRYVSFSPAFSHDSQWLYFLSERQFDARPSNPWGDRNMGPAFDKRRKILAYSLVENADFAFAVDDELDAVTINKRQHSRKNAANNSNKSKQKLIKVAWNSLASRLWEVPIDAGNYQQLSLNEDYMYFIDRPQSHEFKPNLKVLALQYKAKVKSLSFQVNDYALSADGQSLLVRKYQGAKQRFYLIDAGDELPSKLGNYAFNVNHWRLKINPKAEFEQMFHDAWLMHGEQFYDSQLQGLDWPAIKQKYQVLLNRVTHRNDLQDVLAHMIGELNTLHSQIRQGDKPLQASFGVGSDLGAQLVDSKQGVVIKQIYSHDFEMPWRASPLARSGVNSRNGDIISAINGAEVNSVSDVVKALQGQSGRQVLLALKRGKGKSAKIIKTLVEPISLSSARMMRYQSWIMDNQYKVQQNDERLGYLHIYAMGKRDIGRFVEDFYANIHKKGLIIDVRRNRGGNIDSWVLEKLLRKVWMNWENRRGDRFSHMQQTFNGQVVVLTDEGTYSDGETFAAGVKALKLGKVIGKRTAGAGVWLTDRNRLSDGGMARVAELAQLNLDGERIIEGVGVSPDIEVINLPHQTFNGHDAQLQAAIEYLKTQLDE